MESINQSNNDKNRKEKVNTIDKEKKKKETIGNVILTTKTPQNEDTDTKLIERTLKLVTLAVIINKL